MQSPMTGARLVHFVEVDPERAGSRPLSLSHDGAGGSRRFLVHDSYCANPVCGCKTLLLRVFEPSGDPPLEAWSGDQLREFLGRSTGGKPEVAAYWLDLETRVLRVDAEAPSSGEADALRPLLEAALTDEWIAEFSRRKGAAADWGRGDYWRLLPWHAVDRDALMTFETLFPQEKPIGFEHRGSRYQLADEYCMRPKCKCRTMVVDIQTVGHEGAPLRSLGYGRLTAQGNRLRVEEVRGKVFLVQRILDALLRDRAEVEETFLLRMELLRAIGEQLDLEKERRALAANLRARALKGAMPEDVRRELLRFADSALTPAVHGGVSPEVGIPRLDPPDPSGRQEPSDPPFPPLPADVERRLHRKIARNDPCPCGSGRKYKNCCGRSE